ncbi:MAG: Spy/CpxP family protein refolding chaperone [Candidatus Competibacter denitrificans]
MKPFRKKLLIAAAVAGLGLATVTIAQPWGGGDGPMMGGGGDCAMMGGRHGKGHGPMGGNPEQRMAMMQQFHAERMELLEARLKLKPEQTTAWKALRATQDARHAEMVKMRQDMQDKEETAMAFFDERIQGMERKLAGMKSMAKAVGDLYATLDPAQKKVMDDFFTDRPMRRMMRDPSGTATPPAPPAAPPAQ